MLPKIQNPQKTSTTTLASNINGDCFLIEIPSLLSDSTEHALITDKHLQIFPIESRDSASQPAPIRFPFDRSFHKLLGSPSSAFFYCKTNRIVYLFDLQTQVILQIGESQMTLVPLKLESNLVSVLALCTDTLLAVDVDGHFLTLTRVSIASSEECPFEPRKVRLDGSGIEPSNYKHLRLKKGLQLVALGADAGRLDLLRLEQDPSAQWLMSKIGQIALPESLVPGNVFAGIFDFQLESRILVLDNFDDFKSVFLLEKTKAGEFGVAAKFNLQLDFVRVFEFEGLTWLFALSSEHSLADSRCQKRIVCYRLDLERKSLEREQVICLQSKIVFQSSIKMVSFCRGSSGEGRFSFQFVHLATKVNRTHKLDWVRAELDLLPSPPPTESPLSIDRMLARTANSRPPTDIREKKVEDNGSESGSPDAQNDSQPISRVLEVITSSQLESYIGDGLGASRLLSELANFDLFGALVEELASDRDALLRADSGFHRIVRIGAFLKSFFGFVVLDWDSFVPRCAAFLRSTGEDSPEKILADCVSEYIVKLGRLPPSRSGLLETASEFGFARDSVHDSLVDRLLSLEAQYLLEGYLQPDEARELFYTRGDSRNFRFFRGHAQLLEANPVRFELLEIFDNFFLSER